MSKDKYGMEKDKESPSNIRINELNLELINPSTSTYMNPLQGGSKIVVIGKPGCFSLGTEILMYTGELKKVEDVVVGDQVMGPDSKPRNVLELCRNRDEMFDIVPVDGGKKYTVNLKHKLVLKSKNALNDIIEITVEDYILKSDEWKDEWVIFKTAVDFPKKDCDEDNLYEVKTGSREQRLTFLRKIKERYSIPTTSSDVLKISLRSINSSVACTLLFQTTERSEVNGYSSYHYKKCVSDLLFLIRSLGFHANCEEDYMYVMGDLTSLLRSYERSEALNLVSTGNTQSVLECDFKILPVGENNYYGFTLDGDHRFLLGSFDVVRNTGKTTLITSILYAKKHLIPVGIALSGTEDSNGHYKTILPSTFVYNSYDEKEIERFIQRQKLAKKFLSNPWSVLLIDDCTDNPGIFRKPLQQGMYKRGRHWKMLYILSLQYCMDIMPVVRVNVDGTFILRETNLKIRKSLYENYCGIVPSFDLFCQLMDQITDDYSSLYVHNSTQTNDWKDCIFWYKARKTPDGFKFGCPDFWKFHEQRYNTSFVDPFDVI